jgi:hypothetical protein
MPLSAGRFSPPLALMVLAALTIAPSTQAQQPDVFEVVISINALNTPVAQPSPGINTLGQLLHSITAYANESVCARAELATATSNVVLRLGLPGQPAACSTNGAP